MFPSDRRDLTDNLTSPTLIVSLQAGGSDEAWQRVIRLYRPLIFCWCHHSGLQESDAADVSQEVLCDLSGSIKNYCGDGEGATFRGWLWTITRNKIANHYRLKSKTLESKGGTEFLHLVEYLPEKSPESSQDTADLHLRALEGLRTSFNEKTWIAFWRLAIEGDAAKDVADDLGVSIWTVYKARSRVISRLRVELGNESEYLSAVGHPLQASP